MKNRNKRFTSVLAASMALGMMAPAMVSVAPVMAAPADVWYSTGDWSQFKAADVAANLNGLKVGKYVATATTTTGLVYNIYENANVASWDTVGDYVAVLVDGSKFSSQESALTLGPTITAKQINSDTTYEATLVGIAKYAFADGNVDATSKCNTNISSVTIVGNADNPIVIGDAAFINNTSISSVSLSNVKSIGSGAFGTNATKTGKITSVTFNDNALKSIGNYAFSAQKGITSVVIPDSVENIGTCAFSGTSITGTVNLPSSLKTLGAQSFATVASTLDLVWPTSDGADKKITPATDVEFPFNAAYAGNGDLYRKYFRIIGIQKGVNYNAPASLGYTSLNGYWFSCPSITVYAGYNTIDPANKIDTNKNVTVPMATSLTISVAEAGSLYVDGNKVDTYIYDGNNTYVMVTPKLGKHNVTFTSEDNISRTITIDVVEYNNNKWVEGNFSVPNPWVVGTDENPYGAEALYGDVYYVYSTTKNGEYHSEKPAYPGTWWVKAVVDGTANYNGLKTAPQSFQVIAAADINTGWVQSGDNWMYKEDGEFVTDALKEIDGDTYLFDSEGVMVTGWAKNDNTNGKWMFFDNAGHAKKGWLNDNGTWYYLDSNAVMVANEWVKDAGKDYFLTNNGAMAVSRWLTKDGHDVYVDNSGALKTGWLAWNMNWYYLEPSTGYMATSGTVDGWNIQSNGIAVKA